MISTSTAWLRSVDVSKELIKRRACVYLILKREERGTSIERTQPEPRFGRSGCVVFFALHYGGFGGTGEAINEDGVVSRDRTGWPEGGMQGQSGAVSS